MKQEEPALHIVIVYFKEVDPKEANRIKTAVKRLTGEDLRPICPAGSALIFLAHAEFKALAMALDEARGIMTNVFISRLASPCTTIGFEPTLATIQKYLH